MGKNMGPPKGSTNVAVVGEGAVEGYRVFEPQLSGESPKVRQLRPPADNPQMKVGYFLSDPKCGSE